MPSITSSVPRLTLRQLQIFAAVAQHGSTTAAASAVALSQSATSAALGELEEALGKELFDRVGRRLALNDTGRAMLPLARLVLDGVATIETAFVGDHADSAASLRIGASTTIGNYVMPKLVSSFMAAHPRVSIDLRIANTAEVAVAVGTFEVDVGFIEGPCHEPDVRVSPWMSDELVIVCAPGHPLARVRPRSRVTAAMLRHGPWLMREPGSGTREATEQALLPHLNHLQPGMQLGSTEAIRLAAAEGIGIACLSRRVVADYVLLDRLVILNTSLPPLRRDFNVIAHEKKASSPATARFIAHCRSARRI